MAYLDTQLFIDGKWQDASDRRTLPVENPATGAEIGRVAHAARADLNSALKAAQLRDLARFYPPARSKIMRQAAALLRERADGIAADPGTGKTVGGS
jgi:succinate-semialdehyde dehydrogenase/glutarate-semialdehyde dehydrogenase